MPTLIKRGLIALVFLLTGMFVLIGTYFLKTTATQPSVEGASLKEVQKLRLLKEDGQDVEVLRELGEKKLAFINFWATWCAPCLIEIPLLKKSKIGEKAALMWVNLDNGTFLDQVKSVQDARTAKKLEITTYYDKQGDAAEKLEVGALPYSLIINREGKILWRHLGIIDEEMVVTIEKKLSALLSESKAEKPNPM